MAIAFGSVATTVLSPGTSATAPSGIASGDVLLMVVHSGVAATIATSGWTTVLATSSTADATAMAVFRKVAGGSEPGTYTVTVGGGAFAGQVSILRYTGVDGTTPVEVVSTFAEGTDSGDFSQVTIPSITTLSANDVVVGVAAGFADDSGPSSIDNFAGYTSRVSRINDVNLALSIGDKAQAVAGATGTSLITVVGQPGISTSTLAYGVRLALKPATASPPSAPTNFQASAGNAQATLTWDAVTGATSYNLYWSTTPGLGTGGTKVTGVTSPYVLGSLTNGTTYYFVVTAVNAAGESAASTQASATPTAPPPAAPTGVGGSAGNTQITITWNSVVGATSYNLYWSATPGLGTGGTKVSGATSPYVLGGLSNGTTYYFVVTALNAGGESAASSQANATPTAPPPSAPVTFSDAILGP